MRSFFLTLIFIISSYLSIAQEITFTFTFNNSNGTEVIREIENQTGFQFYYKPSWIDTIQFNNTFDKASIETVVKELFEPYEIFGLVQNKQVFLTKDTKIIDQPDIAKALNKEVQTTQNASAGLIFTKDYKSKQANLENRIIEVGNRSKFISGKTSTLVGYIKEKESGNPIAGALIYTEDFSKSSSTNDEGFYAIDLPNGKNTILYQYLGTLPTKRQIVLFSDFKKLKMYQLSLERKISSK